VFTTWQGARFFAVTGHGSCDPTVGISDLIDNWFPAQTSIVPTDRLAFVRPGDVRGTEHIETRTDDDTLSAAATALNLDKFLKLFCGELSDYGGDQSRADQALCCILAYWCMGDPRTGRPALRC